MNYIPLSQRQGKQTQSYDGDPVSDTMESIKKLESSGNYGAIGPKTKSGDEALGAYQIMDKMNLKNWSKEAIGREVTRDEFLESPEIQDQIARHRMQQIYDQYGNKEDVASVWFTGKPVREAGGEVADVTGTTNAEYQKRFKSGLRDVGINTGGMAYVPLAQRV